MTHVSSVSVDIRRRLYHFLRADQLTGNDAGESSLFSFPAAERGVLISASSSMCDGLPSAVFRSRLTEPDDFIEAAQVQVWLLSESLMYMVRISRNPASQALTSDHVDIINDTCTKQSILTTSKFTDRTLAREICVS